MKHSAPLMIIVGDRNLSSWSMRAWLVLRISGLPFREQTIFLDRPSTLAKLKKASPSKRVPVLVHGARCIWDSLARYRHSESDDSKVHVTYCQSQRRQSEGSGCKTRTPFIFLIQLKKLSKTFRRMIWADL